MRHNLSLNKCFRRLQFDTELTESLSFWTIVPEYVGVLRDTLLRCADGTYAAKRCLKRSSLPPGGRMLDKNSKRSQIEERKSSEHSKLTSLSEDSKLRISNNNDFEIDPAPSNSISEHSSNQSNDRHSAGAEIATAENKRRPSARVQPPQDLSTAIHKAESVHSTSISTSTPFRESNDTARPSFESSLNSSTHSSRQMRPLFSSTENNDHRLSQSNQIQNRAIPSTALSTLNDENCANTLISLTTSKSPQSASGPGSTAFVTHQTSYHPQYHQNKFPAGQVNFAPRPLQANMYEHRLVPSQFDHMLYQSNSHLTTHIPLSRDAQLESYPTIRSPPLQLPRQPPSNTYPSAWRPQLDSQSYSLNAGYSVNSRNSYSDVYQSRSTIYPQGFGSSPYGENFAPVQPVQSSFVGTNLSHMPHEAANNLYNLPSRPTYSGSVPTLTIDTQQTFGSNTLPMFMPYQQLIEYHQHNNQGDANLPFDNISVSSASLHPPPLSANTNLSSFPTMVTNQLSHTLPVADSYPLLPTSESYVSRIPVQNGASQTYPALSPFQPGPSEH